ncbi:MAG: hypothetical protein HKUEN02_21730 [Anaerolineaceae bacterium]|nr:MAG: hypothetical protein HKUEN02_21730 [Anaerolineaceae bacterium]
MPANEGGISVAAGEGSKVGKGGTSVGVGKVNEGVEITVAGEAVCRHPVNRAIKIKKTVSRFSIIISYFL